MAKTGTNRQRLTVWKLSYLHVCAAMFKLVLNVTKGITTTFFNTYLHTYHIISQLPQAGLSWFIHVIRLKMKPLAAGGGVGRLLALHGPGHLYDTFDLELQRITVLSQC